jgi:hypothetical protein
MRSPTFSTAAGRFGDPTDADADNPVHSYFGSDLVCAYHLNGDATDFSGGGHDGSWAGEPAYAAGIIQN